jgi:hypothetical protein
MGDNPHTTGIILSLLEMLEKGFFLIKLLIHKNLTLRFRGKTDREDFLVYNRYPPRKGAINGAAAFIVIGFKRGEVGNKNKNTSLVIWCGPGPGCASPVSEIMKI